jgi:hypothetical protein
MMRSMIVNTHLGSVAITQTILNYMEGCHSQIITRWLCGQRYMYAISRVYMYMHHGRA